jgi:hypothetical protein
LKLLKVQLTARAQGTLIVATRAAGFRRLVQDTVGGLLTEPKSVAERVANSGQVTREGVLRRSTARLARHLL